jgi:hypothetical protein
MNTQYLSMSLPTDIEKQWSFAGLICETGQEGRMSDGTIFWGGVPSITGVRRSTASHITAMNDDRRIVSRLQSWDMRRGFLSDHAVIEHKYSDASRAISEINVCEGIQVVKGKMSQME